MLIAWERHGVIPPIAKFAAVLTMLSSFAALTVVGQPPVYVSAILGVILASVAYFILTRPSYPPVEPTPTPAIEDSP
jgi:uncharacterized membrane protein YbaN (DUF454 family)